VLVSIALFNGGNETWLRKKLRRKKLRRKPAARRRNNSSFAIVVFQGLGPLVRGFEVLRA